MLMEIIGWVGSLTMILAYALLSIGRIRAQSFIYQIMNVCGALGTIANSWVHGALPSVFASLVWMVVGALAIVRLVGGSARTDKHQALKGGM